MASKDSLEMRKLAAKGVVFQRGDDASIALRVRYIGTAGTPSMVLTSATKIAMTDATAAVDYAWASYATIGALADALNASGLWEAKILDALRSDVTLNTFKINTTVTASTDENGVVVWDLVHDNNIVTYSTNVFCATVCLSPFYNFDAPKGHQVKLMEVVYNQDVTTAASASYKIYKRLRNGSEVLLQSTTGVTDATNISVDWASGVGFISAGIDYELIFRVQDLTGITDAAANLVRVVGLIE